MNWVLILNTSYTAKPPTVIGGYETRAQAELAGELATAITEPQTAFSECPYYTSYHVIPGAAASGAIGSTYSVIVRSFDCTKWERVTRRFDAIA